MMQIFIIDPIIDYTFRMFSSYRSLLSYYYPVTCHTDHVGPRSTFVAIKGIKENGAAYILQAVERGATTIVVEHSVNLPAELLHEMERRKVKLLRVDNCRRALAQLFLNAD